MRFIKIISVFFVLASMVVYFTACNSAEQTTAKLAYGQGDFKKAETEFEKETKQNPQNEEAWCYLAMSRAQLGNAEGVRTAMTQYNAIGKNSFKGELTQMWGGFLKMAYDEYDNGEKSAKNNKDAEAVNKFSESVNHFEIALALLPDSAFVKDNIVAINGRINTILVKPMIDKGVELEKQGDFAGAINEYNKGLAKVNKGSAAYEVINYNISITYLKWGESMREKNQDDPAYKSKYEAAMPYLEELTGSKDKDNKLNAYDLLIQVYANLGMTEKATDAIKMRDELKNQK